MDDFRAAYRKLLTSSLVCPRLACGAANRPGATIIELDQTGTRAYCNVCSHEAEAEKFTPNKESA